jgi:hypothetical protein
VHTTICQQFISEFKLEPEEIEPFLATIFIYFGDLHLAIATAKFSEYLIYILYRSYKTLLKTLYDLSD